MKKMLFYSLLVTILITQTGCFSVPHLIWPKEDVLARQEHTGAAKTILIASRKSNFKEAVINRIAKTYEKKDVGVKIIGLDNVNQENPDNYVAVVLMNTCMSWDMDRKVNSFLKKYPERNNIFVLTTSGDGGWLPKKKGRRFDAISSASVMADVEKVSSSISNKIDQLLK